MAKLEGPSWPCVLRDPKFKDKIMSSRVLCVGAGGIGCELLKTLVCTGFQNIEVIDLDTIETSNLNRQFLFRKHHVGESKARTAASVVRSIKPAATITAHHANVKETQFGVDYIAGFSLVLNGLDNLEARRHVNRLAMAAGVPLVESGTAGYLGQVTVHVKGETECFECTPKPVPKSFPICTLRNTPDKPIHCVVWAKDLLFTRLFGKPEEISDLDEQTKTEGEDGDGTAAAMPVADSHEENGDKRDDASAFVRRPDEDVFAYAVRIFDRIYSDDIKRLIGMTDLWKTRAPPTPLDLGHLFPDGGVEKALGSSNAAHTSPSRALGFTNSKQVLSTADNARIFLRSILDYHTRRQATLGSETFDKDDDLAVEFVTAASNLRAACYGIPTQSLFDAKGMAGNIIHAIATTNAIISGLIVLEALKLLAGCQSACRSTFLNEAPSGKRLAVPARPDAPNPLCLACGRCVLTLKCDVKTLTLAKLVAGVKKRLAVVAPTLQAGGFLYEEGEGLEDDEIEANARLLPRTLASLPDGGLVSGKILHLSDSAQAFSVDIVVQHVDTVDDGDDGYVLEGQAPIPTADAPPETTVTTTTTDQQQGVATAGVKRGRDQEGEGGQQDEEPSKKSRHEGDGDVPVVLEDDDDVVIIE